jgi:hypothetical protein
MSQDARVPDLRGADYFAWSQLMNRLNWIACLGLLLAVAPGCTICCNPYINDYMSSGGRVTRTDMANGRVGSTLSEGNVYYEDAYEESYGEETGEVYDTAYGEEYIEEYVDTDGGGL